MSDRKDMVKLGGLWTEETKNGEKYLVGSLGPFSKVMIFKNGYKEKDGDNSHVLYISEKQKKKPETEEKSKQETDHGFDW